MCLDMVTEFKKPSMIGYAVVERTKNGTYCSLVFHRDIKYVRGNEYKAKNKEFGFTFFENINNAENYLYNIKRIKKHQNFVVVKCRFRQIEKTGAQEIGSFCDFRTAYTARYRTIIDEVFLEYFALEETCEAKQVGLDKFIKTEA